MYHKAMRMFHNKPSGAHEFTNVQFRRVWYWMISYWNCLCILYINNEISGILEFTFIFILLDEQNLRKLDIRLNR